MNMRKKNQYFKTTKFYLAVFLQAKGLELTGIDRAEPRRCQFIFLDTPQREAFVEAFDFSPPDSVLVQVDVRKLVTAIKQLKDKLYED